MAIRVNRGPIFLQVTAKHYPKSFQNRKKPISFTAYSIHFYLDLSCFSRQPVIHHKGKTTGSNCSALLYTVRDKQTHLFLIVYNIMLCLTPSFDPSVQIVPILGNICCEDTFALKYCIANDCQYFVLPSMIRIGPDRAYPLHLTLSQLLLQLLEDKIDGMVAWNLFLKEYHSCNKWWIRRLKLSSFSL